MYRNPQCILLKFYEYIVSEPVAFKLEEKSEAVVLCLFELQNSLLSLDAVGETINNCITVRTDK